LPAAAGPQINQLAEAVCRKLLTEPSLPKRTGVKNADTCLKR
jgi:hypothetical protein